MDCIAGAEGGGNLKVQRSTFGAKNRYAEAILFQTKRQIKLGYIFLILQRVEESQPVTPRQLDASLLGNGRSAMPPLKYQLLKRQTLYPPNDIVLNVL